MIVIRLVALWVLILGVGSAAAQDAQPDSPRHLIYMHGAIVAIQGLPAVHPVFGEYAFDDIVQAFKGAGFVVHAEVRQQEDDVWVPARKTAALIDSLLADGVAPDHIAVVGASAGVRALCRKCGRRGGSRSRYRPAAWFPLSAAGRVVDPGGGLGPRSGNL